MAITEKGTRTYDSRTNKTNLTFDFGNDFFNLHDIKLPWRIKITHVWVDIKLLYKLAWYAGVGHPTPAFPALIISLCLRQYFMLNLLYPFWPLLT